MFRPLGTSAAVEMFSTVANNRLRRRSTVFCVVLTNFVRARCSILEDE